MAANTKKAADLTISMAKVKETKGAVAYAEADGPHNIYLRKDEITGTIPEAIEVEVRFQ